MWCSWVLLWYLSAVKNALHRCINDRSHVMLKTALSPWLLSYQKRDWWLEFWLMIAFFWCDNYMYQHAQVSLHASTCRSNCSFSHVEGFYHDQVFYFFAILVNFAFWSDAWTRLIKNFQNGKLCPATSRNWTRISGLRAKRFTNEPQPQ